jgi:uncharacterized membrane protein
MKFEISKILGGIGALIIFFSIFTIFGITIVEAVAFVFIGIILVLISLYGLAKFYKDKQIFKNALFGVLSAIIGTIVSVIVAVGIIFPIIVNSIQQAHQDANGNSTDVISGFFNNFTAASWLRMGFGVWLAYFVLCAFIIIAMFFLYKALKKLSLHSHKDLFAKTGLMLLIGAVASIVIVGLLILWIATLLLALAFFTLRKTAPPIMHSGINFCANCGTPTSPETAFCTHCGKQLEIEN